MRKLSLFIMAFLFVTNASANQVIYPAKGQSPEQQKKDESECSSWAVQNSGYNPANPPVAPAPVQAAPQPSGPSGARLRGAAAGALVSEVVGGNNTNSAVAGAVIGGSRERRRRGASAQQAQAETIKQQQAVADKQKAGLASYNKSRAACLEGKGYSVK